MIAANDTIGRFTSVWFSHQPPPLLVSVAGRKSHYLSACRRFAGATRISYRHVFPLVRTCSGVPAHGYRSSAQTVLYLLPVSSIFKVHSNPLFFFKKYILSVFSFGTIILNRDAKYFTYCIHDLRRRKLAGFDFAKIGAVKVQPCVPLYFFDQPPFALVKSNKPMVNFFTKRAKFPFFMSTTSFLLTFT